MWHRRVSTPFSLCLFVDFLLYYFFLSFFGFGQHTRALYFSLDPMGPGFVYASRAGLRDNFHVIVQMRAVPRACFRLLLILLLILISSPSLTGVSHLFPITHWCFSSLSYHSLCFSSLSYHSLLFLILLSSLTGVSHLFPIACWCLSSLSHHSRVFLISFPSLSAVSHLFPITR